MNPGEQHWESLEHLPQYLAGTVDYAICYGGDRGSRPTDNSPPGLILHGYTDADWAGD